MKNYLIITIVYRDEVLADLHDLMLGEYEKTEQQIEEFAASLGAEVFFEESINTIVPNGRGFARVEYNFTMTDEQKKELADLLFPFFADGKLHERSMDTFNTLTAVRFLQTDGQLFEV